MHTRIDIVIYNETMGFLSKRPKLQNMEEILTQYRHQHSRVEFYTDP